MSEPCLATEQRTVPAAELAAWLRDAGVTVVVAAPGAGPDARRAVGPELPVTERRTDEPLPDAAAGVAAVPGRCVGLVAEGPDGWWVVVTPGVDPTAPRAAPTGPAPPPPPPAAPPRLAGPGSVWGGAGVVMGWPAVASGYLALRASVVTTEVQAGLVPGLFLNAAWRAGLAAPVLDRDDRGSTLGLSAGQRASMLLVVANSSWNVTGTWSWIERRGPHTARVLRMSAGVERWAGARTILLDRSGPEPPSWGPMVEVGVGFWAGR